MTGNEYQLLKVKQYFIGIENKQNFTKKKEIKQPAHYLLYRI